MSFFDNTDTNSTYTLKQAIEDGVLVELFKNRWGQLSGGQPIVATRHLFGEVSPAGLMEIWNEFVKWQREVLSWPARFEAERPFHTKMNGKTGVVD